MWANKGSVCLWFPLLPQLDLPAQLQLTLYEKILYLLQHICTHTHTHIELYSLYIWEATLHCVSGGLLRYQRALNANSSHRDEVHFISNKAS